MPPRKSFIVAVACVLAAAASCANPGSTIRPQSDGPVTISVPQQAPTIQQAIDAARPGDSIEISAGTYRESVNVTTADLTVRGVDRNAVVIDGEGLRPNGVVVTADGVTVANLTVTDHTLNGVLVTGFAEDGAGLARGSEGYRRLDPQQFPPLNRFAVRYVTASNNGLYGIYAFDAHDGTIEHNYASGHADSGFYVGQCENCDILVHHNVAEYNAIGYEQANASNVVTVSANRFSNNRVGLTLLSDYQEAFVPQRQGVVTGNLIVDNNQSQTPEQADGGFGIGLGIAGGQQNDIRANRIARNETAGIVVGSAEDIAPIGNTFTGNILHDQRTGLAYTASTRAPGRDNCVAGGELGTTMPAGLADSWRCAQGLPAEAGEPLQPPRAAPAGISFRDVAPPPQQPQLPEDLLGKAPGSPKTETTPRPTVPDETFLADLVRSR